MPHKDMILFLVWCRHFN